jgi:hypothetical protein
MLTADVQLFISEQGGGKDLHADVVLRTVEEPLFGLDIESNAGKYIYTRIHNPRTCGCLRKKCLNFIKLALGTYGLKPAS